MNRLPSFTLMSQLEIAQSYLPKYEVKNVANKSALKIKD